MISTPACRLSAIAPLRPWRPDAQVGRGGASGKVRAPSGVADLEDLEVAGAARGGDLDALAGLLGQQRLGQRRLDREQPRLDVGLLGADDLVAVLLVRLLVDELHPGPEHDLRARER